MSNTNNTNSTIKNTTTAVKSTAKKTATRAKRTAKKAVTTAKKEVKAINSSKLKRTIKDINNFAVETANIVVDETFETASEWQNILDKTVKSGFQVAAKNQDLVFSALESFKGSIKNGTKKFSSIFSKN